MQQDNPGTCTERDAQKICLECFHSGASSVTRLTTGICNYVFDVSVDGKRCVIRMSDRPESLQGSINWLKRLSGMGLPIPDLLYADTGFSPPYIVISRLEGSDLGAVYGSLTGAEKRGICREVVRAQRILATLPPAAGYGYLRSYDDHEGMRASWGEVVLSHLHRSAGRIADNGIFDPGYSARVEELLPGYGGYFESIRPLPFFDDATTKNVLVDKGVFTGIVDLDCICFGDRLYTIALTRMSLLEAGQDLEYIDFWMEEESLDQVQRAVLDLYTLLYCLDFMGEKGMRFNRDSAAAVPERLVRLDIELFESLYGTVRGHSR